MNQFSLAFLFALLIDINILIYSIRISPKTLQINSYIFMVGIVFLTQFCNMMLITVGKMEWMYFWLDISHVLGPLFHTSLAYTIVSFYYDDRHPPKIITIVICVSTIPLLLRGFFNTENFVTMIPNSLGNLTIYDFHSFNAYYYYIHAVFIVFGALIYLVFKYRKTTSNRLKKLSVFLTATIFLIYSIAIPCNLFLPVLLEKRGILIPEPGYLFVTIIAIAFLYAIYKYHFTRKTVPVNTELLLKRFRDGLIFTDADGIIYRYNRIAEKAFITGTNREETNIFKLFPHFKVESNPDKQPGTFSLFDDTGKPWTIIFDRLTDSFSDFIGYMITCRPNNNMIDLINRTALTSREAEVLFCLQDGMDYQSIADRLFISYNTVRNHMQNIYLKTESRNQADLLKKLY